MKFTNPSALLVHQTRLVKATEVKARAMHSDMVRKVAGDATALVSGGISTKELTAMGHPFARRKISRRGFSRYRNPNVKGRRISEKVKGRNVGAAISVPLLPINVQGGRLKRSLRMRAATPPTNGQSWQLGFTTPYAKFVLAQKGTKRMVARGYQAAMTKVNRKRNKQLEHDIRLMILTAAATGKV